MVTKENRYVSRVVGTLSTHKPKLSAKILNLLLQEVYGNNNNNNGKPNNNSDMNVDMNDANCDYTDLVAYLRTDSDSDSADFDKEFVCNNIKGLNKTNTPEVCFGVFFYFSWNN